MKVADLFVATLKEQVRHIFGLPGEELEDLLRALENSPINFITTRHEQGASFAAAAYGRVSGEAGVCMATLGPGAMNLVTGVAEAYLDNFPLVAINAQQDSNPHQYIDTAKIFAGITKHSTKITTIDQVIPTIKDALLSAQIHPQGAVHIELPEQVARETVQRINFEPYQAVAEDSGRLSDLDTIEIAADQINSAPSVMLLIGDLVAKNPQHRETISVFSQQFNIPVVTSFMGKGSVDDFSPLSLLSIGLGAPGQLFDVLSKADLIVMIGYDPVEGVTRLCDPNVEMISINEYRITHSDICSPTLSIVGDISDVLSSISSQMSKKATFAEAFEYRSVINQKIIKFHNDNFPYHPLFVLNSLRDVIKKDAIVISDVGAHKMWIGSHFQVKYGQTIIIPNGLASMGFSLPAAIGAKLAAPEKQVIALAGDGGFLMNIQELETAVRTGLDLTLIVFVDETYSLIKAKFKNAGYETEFSMNFGNPDFKLLAESFGVKYFDGGSKKNRLESLLKAAVYSKGVSLITIPLDTSSYDELF